MTEETSKTTENNKRGFALFPENINRNGRPPKGLAWAEILEEVGNEIDPKTGKPFKELVSRKMWSRAVLGDIVAAREIMDRMEGRPKTNDPTLTAVQINNYNNLNDDQLNQLIEFKLRQIGVGTVVGGEAETDQGKSA